MMPTIDNPDKLNHPAAGVLMEYIQEMYLWETRAWARFNELRAQNLDELEAFQEANQQLGGIYAKYLTPRKRLYGRGNSLGSPPEYDPNLEHIIDVQVISPSRAVIFTQKTSSFIFKFQYVMRRTGDQWRIDSRKRLNYEGKWVRDII